MFRYNETGGNAVLATRIAGHDLILRSGNNTTALTLDSSQNATFAGSVTVSGVAGSDIFYVGDGTTTSAFMTFAQSNPQEWDVGITTGEAFVIRDVTNGNVDVVTFSNTTGNATFAGDVTVTGSGSFGSAGETEAASFKGDYIRLIESNAARTLDIYPAQTGTNHVFTSTTTSAGYRFENNAGALFEIFSTGDATLSSGDLTLSANNSTLTFATDTVSPGDRLGAIVFHDTDGATGANSGELHITGERGNDKDAPDYVLKIADASGVLTERDRIDGTTGARTLAGDLTLSSGDLLVGFNQNIRLGSATYPFNIYRDSVGNLFTYFDDHYDSGNARIKFRMRVDGSAVTPLELSPSGVNVAGNLTVGGTEVTLSNLPTADPTNAGQLWNDSGTVKVSAG
jgi:hypothetical protein